MRGGGIKRKILMVLFIVIIAGLSPFYYVFVTAQNEETVKIHMLGEKTRTRFNNQVIVAGIWHYFNVTLDTQDFQELNLKFYSGDIIPNEGDRDDTNYYEWQYNKNNENPWIDIKKYDGRDYINSTRCAKNANNYSFCVGVKDALPSQPTFYHKNWTLEVYIDGDKVRSEKVVVEKPYVGIAKTHGDIIIINVDPFTKMDALGNDYFRIENTRNIPLIITIDYGLSKDTLEFLDYDTKISPYNNVVVDGITIHSEAWPPGKRDVEGTISGEVPSSYIIPVATVTFGTSIGLDAPILRIVAAHGNYELEEFPGNITFQYQKTLEMSEGEIKNITTYVSGNGDINFDLRSENLSILKVFSEDNEVNAPFVISSTNTSEHVVTIRIKAIRETSIAYLHYIVEIGGEIYEYDTLIAVSPPQSSQEEVITLDFLLIIAIVVIICLVMGYMIHTHLKYRRR